MYMLEEGEKDGEIRLLMTAIRGREIVVAEVIVRVLPFSAQVSPEGSEHEAAEVTN
jgi:hypothetical protein